MSLLIVTAGHYNRFNHRVNVEEDHSQASYMILLARKHPARNQMFRGKDIFLHMMHSKGMKQVVDYR